MAESPAEPEIKPADPEVVRVAPPPEQLVQALVEEWASSTDEMLPEHREAA
jgi:hypothetical protein